MKFTTVDAPVIAAHDDMRKALDQLQDAAADLYQVAGRYQG